MIRPGGRSGHRWSALRHRNYRLFLASQALSMSGAWMQHVALGWLVLDLTDDPFMLGLVAAAQFSPVVILGLIGGLVADHLPKRTVLVSTLVVQLALSIALFVLAASDDIHVWHILSIAALQGISQSFEQPTRQSFFLELVGRDDLINATGLSAATINIGRIIGPATAGLVISSAGIAAAFLVNALVLVPVLVALLAIRPAELIGARPMARPVTLRELGSGLIDGPRFVASQPVIRMVVVVLAIIATFGLNFVVLAPPLARDILGMDARGFGLLMTASGAGSLAAAMVVVFARRISPRAAWRSATLLGVALVVLAISRSFPLSLVAMAAAGAGAIGLGVAGNTVLQLAVPDELRGRVVSVWVIVMSASIPFGGLLLGAIASRASVPIAIGIGGIVSTATALTALAWYRHHLDAEARQPSIGERAQSVETLP